MEVNLMSDTVTRPSEKMKAFMFDVPLGDDVFGQDPTVNALQDKVADMFGREAALYCPSGTMTNQIALQLHCGQLGAIICEKGAHVYQYETGGYAYNARAAVNLIAGRFGKITGDQIISELKPDHDWYSRSRVVVIENTSNTGGGTFYTLSEVDQIRDKLADTGLTLHLDGARLFNALAETGDDPALWGSRFETISICLSKGLGAPVGSVLIGDKSLIREARRLRKVMGGGMRQAGIIAAAGIYALDHNLSRLSEDHDHAKQIGLALEEQSYVSSVNPVMTNIVIFELTDELNSGDFLSYLAGQGVLGVPLDQKRIRLVTHLDITSEMIEHTVKVLYQYPSKPK